MCVYVDQARQKSEAGQARRFRLIVSAYWGYIDDPASVDVYGMIRQHLAGDRFEYAVGYEDVATHVPNPTLRARTRRNGGRIG